MKLLISGFEGHMGQIVAGLVKDGYKGAELAGGVDIGADGSDGCFRTFDEVNVQADCILDFSHHSSAKALLDYAVKTDTPVVIATTGHTDEEKELIKKASEKIAVFYAANLSYGIALLIDMAKKTAAALPDAEIEIVETHHDRKLDAPSGTALAIAAAIQQVRDKAELVLGRNGQSKRTKTEIGIHAVRMGNVAGIHEVIIGTPSQTITLKHEAHDRAVFAEGAVVAAEYIIGRPAGLYNMEDMVG